MFEQWGTGTLSIIEWCKENQNPHPLWEEQPGSVMITFLPSAFFLEKPKEVESASIFNEARVTGQDKILEFCKQPRTAKEIVNHPLCAKKRMNTSKLKGV